jgi:hypothetical protein
VQAIQFGGLEPIFAIPNGPFRANLDKEITEGKLWAMLYWPLRAKDWKDPNYRPFGPYSRR